jgi:putative addiction module killer protein
MTECYRLLETEEFEDWLNGETARSRRQIGLRLGKIRLDGHFGTKNNVSRNEKGDLKDQVWEIKFNDGRRIYYAIIPEKNIILLLGGNKNGQSKDIAKSKALYLKHTKEKGKEKPYGNKTSS